MNELDLGRYISIIKKWFWLIALCTVIAGVVGFIVTKLTPPEYRATATILVGNIGKNPNINPEEFTAAQRLAENYANMATRQPVLEAVVTTLGLPYDWQELKKRVVTVNVNGTQFIEIRATANTPDQARVIVAEIVKQLTIQSPTAENAKGLESRRQFAQQQLDELQNNIRHTQETLDQKRLTASTITDGIAALNLEREIQALETVIAERQATYANILQSITSSQSANTLETVEQAYAPPNPYSPNLLSNVLFAGVIGLLLPIVAILIIDYFDDTVKTPDDITKKLAFAILGSITDSKPGNHQEGPITPIAKPDSAAMESYRLVRSNLLFNCAREGIHTLMVTSVRANEGQSTVTVNLAVSLAQSGKRVILVDANLRNPSIHKFFNSSDTKGMTSLLLDQPLDTLENANATSRNGLDAQKRSIAANIQWTEIPYLTILAAGQSVSINGSELLSSPAMENLLSALQQMADIVILDVAPVLASADAVILSSLGVGVLLVAEAGKTYAKDICAARESLLQTEAHILGVILNSVSQRNSDYLQYSYPNRKERVKRRRWTSFLKKNR